MPVPVTLAVALVVTVFVRDVVITEFCVSVLVLLFCCACFAMAVGGSDVCPPQNYPHLVSLQTLGSHFCGGTLYGDRHVITAAHCLFGTSAFELSNMKVAINRHDLLTTVGSEVSSSLSCSGRL